MDLADRIIPGDGNAEGTTPAEWKACGFADGVIYFDDLEGYDRESNDQKLMRVGTERQALRYLLGPKMLDKVVGTDMHSRVCEAIDRCMTHTGQVGMCECSIEFLLRRYPEIEREAEAAGHSLQRKFLSSKAGINANLPQHAKRWQVVKAEAGVWCVFYV